MGKNPCIGGPISNAMLSRVNCTLSEISQTQSDKYYVIPLTVSTRRVKFTETKRGVVAARG